MPWQWSQSKGLLTGPAKTAIATGYAGNGDGLNNPAMQDAHGVGPLPQGEYLIGDLMPSHDTVGLNVLPLIPNPDNKMFGRSGFFIHGDNPAMNHSASDGCIVLPLWVRMQVSDSDDRQLVVVP